MGVCGAISVTTHAHCGEEAEPSSLLTTLGVVAFVDDRIIIHTPMQMSAILMIQPVVLPHMSIHERIKNGRRPIAGMRYDSAAERINTNPQLLVIRPQLLEA